MFKSKLLSLVFILVVVGLVYPLQWEVPLTVTDGLNTLDLVIGIHPNGTIGYDPGLDIYAPPPPPPGAFDARLVTPPPDEENFLKDIRSDVIEEKMFRMKYAAAAGQGPIEISWDPAYLATLGTFFIVDDITGTLFGPIDMTTQSSLVVTNPLILTGLRMLVTPMAINAPPVAVNDTVTTDEDTPIVINVLANDFDPDGTLDPTTVTIVTPPSSGTAVVDPVTGDVTYTPDPNYFGTDMFTYTVDDNQGATSNEATVYITINSVNDPPVAVDDAATTAEDTPVDIDVLANDYDPDGTLDLTTVTVVMPAANGTTVVNPTTGVVTYTPNPGFSGSDQFTYTVKDNEGATSNEATVSITVTSVNFPPVAVNDTVSTNEDTPIVISVLANDYDPDGTLDPATVTIGTGPAHGTVSVNPATGDVTYSPDLNFFGNDMFTYTVKDNEGATSNEATVYITVLSVNDPPVAVDDSATTDQNVAVVVDVLANDFDIDGTLDPTTVTVVGAPAHGTTAVDPVTGEVTYTPDVDFSGMDSFTYTVDDNQGATSNVATVHIRVLVPITAEVIYTVGDGIGGPGNVVQVAVSIDYPDTIDICAFGFNLHFDPAVLSYYGWALGPIIPAAGFYTDATVLEPGKLNISGFSTTGIPLAGSGKLAFISFKISETAPAGPTPLSFSIATAGNCQGQDLTTDYSDMGHIMVVTVVSLCGNITYFDVPGGPAAAPVSDIPVYLLNVFNLVVDTTITDNAGQYCFNNVPAGQDYVIMPKRVDDPNRVYMAVNPTDAFRAFAAATYGMPFPNPFQFIVSDANNNNSFNPTDAFVIFQLASYQIPNLRAYNLDDWSFVDEGFPLNPTNWKNAPFFIRVNHVLHNITDLDFIGGINADANGSGAGLATGFAKQAKGTVSLTIPEISMVDETVEVPVTFETGGNTVGAFGFELQFDPSQFEYSSYRTGSIIPNTMGWTLHLTEMDQGKVYVAGFATDMEALIKEDGALVYLTFKKTVAGNEVTGEFTFTENVSAGNHEGEDLNVFAKGAVVTGGQALIPTQYVLEQNYPNPFNPVTHIRFGIPKDSHVRIEVYNAIGQQVAVLLNEPMTAGYHEVKFDPGTNGSGVYFYTIKAGDFTAVKKMLFMK
ncbi:MAG: hypothetical protein Kow0042_15990 [Calditrichia bacterium]